MQNRVVHLRMIKSTFRYYSLKSLTTINPFVDKYSEMEILNKIHCTTSMKFQICLRNLFDLTAANYVFVNCSNRNKQALAKTGATGLLKSTIYILVRLCKFSLRISLSDEIKEISIFA